MKQRLLIVWMACHLLFIIISNIASSYDTYNKFKHKDWPNLTLIDNLLYSALARFYGIFTGAETGYGFFGFNVRSNGIFIAECGVDKLTAEFKSGESSIRFFSLTGSLTDELLEEKEHGRLKENQRLIDSYHELAIKNVAVTLYNKYHCLDSSIIISYNLINFPSLSDFRKIKSGSYELVKIRIFEFRF